MEAAEVDSAAVEKWIENRMHEAKDLHKVEWYRVSFPFELHRCPYSPTAHIALNLSSASLRSNQS